MKNARSDCQFHIDDLPMIVGIWGVVFGLMTLVSATIFLFAR